MRAGIAWAGLSLWGLVFASASAWGQYDEPFSHRRHLGEYGAVCQDCHSGAASSTEASDSLMPSVAACAKCHGPGSISDPAELTVSKFNHRLHGAIPGVGPMIAAAMRSRSYLGPVSEERADKLEEAEGCMVCHLGVLASSAGPKAAYPPMADCLVCHTDVEAPFTCEKCHDAGPHLMPASHTGQYLEQHSRPGYLKETESCAVCHGREFTCLGCH